MLFIGRVMTLEELKKWLFKRQNAYYTLKWVGVCTGILLTIISWTGLCSESCAQVHEWRILGFPFEIAGLLFFVGAGVLLYLSRVVSWAAVGFSLLVASGVGAELQFMYVQKILIGQWCPVCLTIASTVFFIAIVLIAEVIHESKMRKGKVMNLIRNFTISFLVVIFGFIFALLAVVKPEPTFAEDVADIGKPFFGKENSQVDVYVITDWFCKACKKKEPELQKLYPRIMSEARLYFIDFPIHDETRNYMPYNISFMLMNKDKYFEIRKALINLSKTSQEPTLTDMQNAVGPLGIRVKMISYADIDSGQDFFEGITDTFQVRSTPTVVIANRSTLEAKKIKGSRISEKSIMDAIEALR